MEYGILSEESAKALLQEKSYLLEKSLWTLPLDPYGALWGPYPLSSIALSNIVMIKGILSEEAAKALLQEKSDLIEEFLWAVVSR